VHSFNQLTKLRPQQRLVGAWSKPEPEQKEPARTERLLARPLTILHDCSSDMQEAMLFHVFVKASGNRLVGLCFQWASMLVQVLVGVLSGLGPYIAHDTGAATAQVLAVIGIKLGWACVLLCYRPCLCGLNNAVVVTQFLLEGGTGLVLFCTQQDASASIATVQTFTFPLLLLPVVLPVLLKIYDGLIVAIVVNCCRQTFNPRAALGAMIIAILAIPSALANFLPGGVSLAFNPAKLTAAVNPTLNEARKARKGSVIKVARSVQHLGEPRPEGAADKTGGECAAAALAVGAGSSGMDLLHWSTRRRNEGEEEAGGGGDGGDGGDAGD